MAQPNWNPETSATQKAQVRAWLLQGNHLTPLEALRRFNSLRLSAIIFDLREEGLPIKTDKIVVSTRKRVADYYISKEDLEKLNVL
jgi:hypothetical protein